MVTTNNYKGFLIDIILYIAVMFLIREVYFKSIAFLANGLFWSLTALLVASWRMNVRQITWKDLGLRKPRNVLKSFGASIIIVISIVFALLIFQILKDNIPMSLKADTSIESATSKFGNLKGNWTLFFTIMPVILIESFLEEILDRGFLLNWIERLFSSTSLATIIAIVLQAAIFGFRHSNDFSERSITVGIIGLIMGIAYVKLGRNLWPIIIAHCLLNTFSMLDRV